MGRRAQRRALAAQRAAELEADAREAKRRAAEHDLLADDGSLGAVQADAVRRHCGEVDVQEPDQPKAGA